MCVGVCIDLDSEIDLRERRTVVCVPIRPVTALIRSVTVPIQSVTVCLARRGFQHSVLYCLLSPTVVHFAVLSYTLYNHKDRVQ